MLLTSLGAFVGLLSVLLGVGGGIMLVPALVALKYSPLNAVATSALAVALIALSGSYSHYKKHDFNLKNLSMMALPCVVATQIGVLAATYIRPGMLLFLFGCLILCALALFAIKTPAEHKHTKTQVKALLCVGSIAGFLSGMFGVGGGVILVPLQVLMLNLGLKTAIRNSLAVVLVASCFSTLGHALAGHIMFKDGLLLGLGGVVGAQFGAQLVPKISELLMRRLFIILLFLLAFYVFWQAYNFSQ